MYERVRGIDSPRMIYAGRYANVGPSLGFSLNPFSLIKSGIAAAKKFIKGSSVTVTTPAGTGSAGATPPLPTPEQQIKTGLDAIPGGLFTVAAVGIGAVLLGSALSRRRG